ncbi:MAG: DbpA RNA binding domain-containing protein, partial [Muribaculaceae bacterium]|nr:DbpA RNA binding domain-containing protein [Muribaculaceae bacterium]
APLTDKEKDRRTAEKGMERIYINLGKNDGFYAGNLIEMLTHNVPGTRIDVGRIDLLPGYSLFDVRKPDSRRLTEALRGLDWMGKHVHCEIAQEDKDYAKASRRKSTSPVDNEAEETIHDYFLKKSRSAGKKAGKKTKKR